MQLQNHEYNDHFLASSLAQQSFLHLLDSAHGTEINMQHKDTVVFDNTPALKEITTS